MAIRIYSLLWKREKERSKASNWFQSQNKVKHLSFLVVKLCSQLSKALFNYLLSSELHNPYLENTELAALNSEKMADGVLFNIAEGIISKLGSLAIDEIGLWWGVNDEIEKLKSTVSTIKDVLLDSEKKSLQSDQIKGWLGQLKEAVYDADDFLDDFSTEVLRRKVMAGNKIAREVRLFFSSSNKLVYGFRMAHKIKEIRARLDLIAESRKFHLVQQSVEGLVMAKDREQTHSSLPEVVFGREDDKNAIVEFLLSSKYKEKMSIISIVGIGGLGKTTLAQMIYNDESIKMHFDLKIWVCVSDNFDVKLVVEKILESITSVKHHNSEMDALKNKLHEKISGKKYLIVLDDLWNEDPEKWFRLRDLLVVGAVGSKIIITTRIKKIAEIVRSFSTYELEGLGETDSWSLFKQSAFNQEKVLSSSHEAIGKEIVAKCVGVPLAIKTIGRLLFFKETESEWLFFKNVELSRIDQNENDILSTLKLSYNHLPSHLKHCFAYCKLFPKDHEFEVKTLIYLWMAQGYIKPSNSSQSLEDIGMEYFKELAWRSFFQEIKKDFFGNIWECKMHDLMHDMAMQVGGEESVLIEAGAEYANNNEKARHISFDVTNSASLQQFSLTLDRKKLRTLLLLNTQWSVTIEEGECNLIFSNLRCLRVLDLHSLRANLVQQSSISKLKHLRYLDLSNNMGIEMLPNSITRLQNLQVLKLTGCWNLKQLPKDMKKLVNLRQLDIRGCDSLTHMPRGLGKLSCLEQLSRFIVADQDNPVYKHSSGLGELHGLNNLRGEFEIVNLQYVKNAASEFKVANLKDKHRLQSLTLAWNSDVWFPYVDDEDDYEMSLEELRPHVNLKGLSLNGNGRMKIPSWLSSLANLAIIEIRNFSKCQHLPPLQQFPCLKRLIIHELTNLEYIDCEVINCDEKGESASSFFPPLESFWLSNCPNLKGWRRKSTVEVETELPQFPCLSYLEIDSCPNLISMPPFPSLTYLSFGKSSVKLLETITKKTVSVAESSSSSSLKYIYIRNIEDLDLVSLPVDLLQIITQINLYIWTCPNLISLPDWMCNLNISTLSIRNCPQLSERCNNNMAEDWPKIAHIPNIEIDDKMIQENGRYKLRIQ